ncbi:LD-carboxypeptidase [Nocardia sp. NPDC059691]|uniref:S66 peptidase family protein n=1 Tax=Nocardia sp. NPDC059691 TaxID=3346908 RepID=UPI0036967EE1
MAAPVPPPALRPGDAVGIATPSNSIVTPRRLERGVRALTALGLRPVVGPLALAQQPSAARRAEELNGYLRDPQIRGVFCTIGGYTTNGVLDSLDYSALRRDPKVVVGYSDITALLLAVLTRSELMTFHGPTVLPELGEYPAPLPYTASSLMRAVTCPEPLGLLPPSPVYTDQFHAWDEADDRPRDLRAVAGWRWLNSGDATGRLLGGNLETLCALTGTKYLPSFAGAVLVCETASSQPDQISRDLNHLAMAGVFDDLAGVLFGRAFRVPREFDQRLDEIVLELFAPLGVPVVTRMHIGHGDPMLTLPLGARVRLDSVRRTIEVIDAPVR